MIIFTSAHFQRQNSKYYYMRIERLTLETIFKLTASLKIILIKIGNNLLIQQAYSTVGKY